MKIFKFRWHDENGLPVFKEIELPDDAVVCRGHDYSGREVYEGDEICGQDLKHGHVKPIEKTVLKHFAVIDPNERQRDKKFFTAYLAHRTEEIDPLCYRFSYDPEVKASVMGQLVLL